MTLRDLLYSRKCFKLVCGAGNEDAVEVEKLVALYAKAGANYFDLSAKPEVVKAAQSGLRRVVSPAQLSNYHLNVSVGIKGDPHVSKAIVEQSQCTECGICFDNCLQKAIIESNGTFEINATRCIGCGDCGKSCPEKAISFYSEPKPVEEVLPPVVDLGIHSIEFHAVSEDEAAVQKQWRMIENCFDGILSVCIDRSILGNKQLLERVRRMLERREPYTTIIQADGAPMSGSEDKPETTLQALACARIIQEAKLPVFLILSGGTNSKTGELAKLFNIEAHGIAIGSFARQIVRQFIDRDDFLENGTCFDEALAIARILVRKSVVL